MYTPLIQQYLEIKKTQEDAILFFRLGDFYEMFFDDALLASKELEIVLTKRNCGEDSTCPMCGVPYHVADEYIKKLVNKGFKVAICEQLEDPKTAESIVKRGIVRVVTPGTALDLEDNSHSNYLMSIFMDSQHGKIEIAYTDISQGKIYCTTLIHTNHDLENEINRISPSEILISDPSILDKMIIANSEMIVTKVNNLKNIEQSINHYLNHIDHIDSFLYTQAVAILLEYIFRYQDDALPHLNQFCNYSVSQFLELDTNTIYNLELLKNVYTQNKKGSLFGVLDATKTSLGSRFLKYNIERPLLDIEMILKRQKYIEGFFKDISYLISIRDALGKIYDMERIIAKLSFNRANGRDLIALKQSLEVLPEIKKSLSQKVDHEDLSVFDDLHYLYTLLDKAIVDDPPITITEGSLIKSGFDDELDAIRSSKINGLNQLVEYENSERKNTDIKNLKIVFNKKLGYFLDVTKSNLGKVPEYYEKKQTLTNSERYKTEELEKIEKMILGSESDIFYKEYQIFSAIRDEIMAHLVALKKTATYISEIDFYCSLAYVAYKNNYIKPQLNLSGILHIVNGRHPIVESSIGTQQYIANHTSIGSGKDNIQIITGPNMSGKSTYLRQVALICILAQIGSYVPAEYATISLVDKIFTRIGASDNLYKGESTFMVEMKEVSYILNHATKHSLLILDEVGRGTSTFDGLAIAWAIIEYISKTTAAKTLFATHYHELIILSSKLNNVCNMHVLIEENKTGIIFLRKIVPGYTTKSYGIEVAKLAGLPKSVVNRAHFILNKLDEDKKKETLEDMTIDDIIIDDLDGFNPNIDFIKDILSIDINTLTPIESLQKLDHIIKKAKEISEELK